MLTRAYEAEVAEFLDRYRFDRDEGGRAHMVRSGTCRSARSRRGWARLASRQRGCGVGPKGFDLPP